MTQYFCIECTRGMVTPAQCGWQAGRKAGPCQRNPSHNMTLAQHGVQLVMPYPMSQAK